MTGIGREADRRRDELGITLVEVLIVLAVIAIAGGATALSLGVRRDEAVEIEARLLAAAIEAAADRSIATGVGDRLTVGHDSYAIGGSRHRLAAGTTMAAATGPAIPLRFGSDAPFDLVVAGGGDRWRVAFDGLRATATRVKDGA